MEHGDPRQSQRKRLPQQTGTHVAPGSTTARVRSFFLARVVKSGVTCHHGQLANSFMSRNLNHAVQTNCLTQIYTRVYNDAGWPVTMATLDQTVKATTSDAEARFRGNRYGCSACCTQGISSAPSDGTAEHQGFRGIQQRYNRGHKFM